MSAALRIDGLTVEHQRAGAWHRTLEDLSLAIAPGEAYGLIGASGSGKTTLGLAALHYLPPTARIAAGHIAVAGLDLGRLPPDALRRARGRTVGAVYQHPGAALNPMLRIGRQITEVLELHRDLHGEAARQAAAALLADMQLAEPATLLDRYPHQLSGGMQQRVVIAMALAADPALLILDEPTSALDATVQAEILALLQRLRARRGMAMLLITHDVEAAAALCDRVGVLHAGRLVEEGPAEQVLRRPQSPHTAALLRAPARLPPAVEAGAPILAATGLGVVRQGRAILEGVDLSLLPGRTLGLIGESGSGKTTLLRILAGLMKPDQGAVTLDGHPLATSVRRRTPEERRAVQMVFQAPDATLNPLWRVGRIVGRAVRRLAGLPAAEARNRGQALLEAVQLPPGLAGQRPGRLSGGQKQRVAIARAFAGSPRVVLLDEPTSALDPAVQAAMLGLLADLQRRTGAAYLLVSHDLTAVRSLCHDIGVLYRGRLVESAPAARLFTAAHHPYSRRLLGLEPAAPGGADRSAVVGCPFRPDCPRATERCIEMPPVTPVAPDHSFRCWNPVVQSVDP